MSFQQRQQFENNIMFRNIWLLLLQLSILILTSKQEKIVLRLPPCRFTLTAAYELLICEKRDQCSRQQPSSSTVCNRYSYSAITDVGDCISTCCPQLFNSDGSVPTDLNQANIKLCYQQYQIRYAVYIISIAFGVIGGGLILVGIAYAYLNCFVKNPYTGKKVYVGCWCCKKNIDFEEDYKKQIGQIDRNSQKSQKAVMEAYEEKKPNLIFQ